MLTISATSQLCQYYQQRTRKHLFHLCFLSRHLRIFFNYNDNNQIVFSFSDYFMSTFFFRFSNYVVSSFSSVLSIFQFCPSHENNWLKLFSNDSYSMIKAFTDIILVQILLFFSFLWDLRQVSPDWCLVYQYYYSQCQKVILIFPPSICQLWHKNPVYNLYRYQILQVKPQTKSSRS